MSRHIFAPAGFTLGDGTTAASVVADRWRRFRWIAVFLGISAATIAVALLFPAGGDRHPLSIENPTPDGARALAEVMKDRGVSIVQVRSLEDAARAVGENDTLVIAFPSSLYYVDPEQADSIARHPGPVVWLGPEVEHLGAFSGALTRGAGGGFDERSAECDAPVAIQADHLASRETRDIRLLTDEPAVTVCFPGSTEDSGAYVVVEREGAAAHLISDPRAATNEYLAEGGNAALLINAIAQSDRVVWYIGSPLDDTILALPEDARASDYIEQRAPTWVGAAVGAAALAALVALLWRGRRFGKLVVEPLPVVVRAAETTRGRGRLYRKAAARGRASASLRAGAASRMARTLGVPQSADAASLVSAVEKAAGLPIQNIEALLYGPPPRSDRTMVDLIKNLDVLERKVTKT